MRRRSLSGTALAAAWLAATGLLAADDLRVTARLQPEVIGVDELAHFTIEVEGGGFGGRGFEPEFELENLEILSGPSTSQSFRFVNGVSSRSESRSWILRPLAVGPGRVRSIRVEIGDRVYAPPDTEIEIQRETVGRQQPGLGLAPSDPFEDFFPDLRRRGRTTTQQPKVFLRAEVEPRDPYVGQQALYTLYLFTQVDVTSINPERLPEFNGLWVRDLPQPTEAQLEMVDIDGDRFGRTAILRRAIFPLRPGPIRLEAARVQLGVRVPDRTFGSLFSQTRRIGRDSNALELEARSLPESPPGFQGAVGELSVSSRVEPAALRVGDAATFVVTLSGAGHIQGLPAPELPSMDGLHVFPPQQESDERIEEGIVHGRRTWTFVLVPQDPGRYQLPSIEVPYFDPERQRYDVASAPAIALAVRSPVSDEAAGGEPAPEEAATVPEAAPDSGSGFAWKPWALALAAGGAVLGLLALLVRRRAGGPPVAADLRGSLRRAAQSTKPREAAALIEEGWRAYLAARWGIPPSTPSTQWGRQLGEAGCPPEAAAELVRLADDLHYLRYAPQLSDVAALRQELISRSKKLVRALQ